MKVIFLFNKRTKFLATEVEMKKQGLNIMILQHSNYTFTEYLEAFGPSRALESFPSKT